MRKIRSFHEAKLGQGKIGGVMDEVLVVTWALLTMRVEYSTAV
jgi:hypothetical protein